MLEILQELLKDKKVLIFGFLKEGQLTYKLLKNLNICASLDITDISFEKDEKNILSFKTALERLNDYDIVFKDENKPMLRPEDYKCLITCQADILLKAYKNDLISVAGSRGKSTVSSMIKGLLKDNCLYMQDKHPFEYLEYLNKQEVIVLEIPDSQLLYIHNNATISIIMNCFEETIGEYKDKKDYQEAYKNLYKYQVKGDNLICNLDFYYRKYPGALSVIGTRRLPFRDLSKIDSHIYGLHNMYNLCVVYEIAYILDISKEEFGMFVKDFMPLRRHQEFIGSGLLLYFYDDSYSRYINDTICAIRSIPSLNTIIIGGNEDKNPGLLIEELYKNRIENVVLFGSFGKEIYNQMLNNKRKTHVYYCDNYLDTFKKAVDVCEASKAICLSPACKTSEKISKDFREFVNKI